MDLDPARRGTDVPSLQDATVPRGVAGLPAAFPPSPPAAGDPRGLGSTCLKWGQDGELTSVDLRTVLERLCVHDPQACRLLDDAAAWS